MANKIGITNPGDPIRSFVVEDPRSHASRKSGFNLEIPKIINQGIMISKTAVDINPIIKSTIL
jgi:hypothetical protein